MKREWQMTSTAALKRKPNATDSSDDMALYC